MDGNIGTSVMRIISEISGGDIDPSASQNATFGDLDFDSLARHELLIRVSSSYSINLKDLELEDTSTPSDVAAMIGSRAGDGQ